VDLIHLLSWKVTAKEPSKWGRRTTDEEKEEMQKEKHTPGKKKKRGRSQHIDKYSEELTENLEKGKRCGDSYIAKEDECHQNEYDVDEGSGGKLENSPKKPRVQKRVPHGRLPKTAKQPGMPEERFQQPGAPEQIETPENGVGQKVGNGYLADGTDGIYEVEKSTRPHRVYFPAIVDQAASQYLCSGIADLMKLASHVDYFYKNKPTNQVGAGHEMLPFTELDEMQLGKLAQTNPDIAGWFVHSVLVRNETPTGDQFDNMVLLKNGRPTIRYFGGCLLWTEMGNRRPGGMSPEALPELQELRSSEMNWNAAAVFGKLTDEQVAAAIKQYLEQVREKDILDLVDASKFAPDDRSEIGKGLVMRKRMLESLAGEDHGEV
jgi:hypothetical protein